MDNSKLLLKAKRFLSKFKKLNNDDLSKVSGAGMEPEEFDWKPKGYVTPEKGHDENEDWAFGPIGNKNIKNKKDLLDK